MIWLIFAIVVLVVFGALDASLTNLPLLGADSHFYVMSILLLGCAFLCLKFNQFSTKSILARLSLAATNVLIITMIALLFLVRTLGVEQDFRGIAGLISKQGYTVNADVHITQISDGVYGEGMYYRQQAVLSNVRFYEGQSQLHANTPNPFGVIDDDLGSYPLPKTLTVMLQAGQFYKEANRNLVKLQELRPHTTTQMTLLITPLDTEANVSGFDGGRWLRTRHIHANAKIISINGEIVPLESAMMGGLENFRQRLRDYFYQDWHKLSHDKRQAKAVTLSLLTGDRALIDKNTKELYQFGGISHLLAISGTHVVFLALILSHVLCVITDRFSGFYYMLSRHHFRMMVMVLASLVYALFTGFDVPAVRTVYMMLVVAVASYLALPISSMTALVWVALIMIWFDPVVVWQAGFWLSFVAVGLLMSYGEREFESVQMDFRVRMVHLIKLQSYLFVTMLPISLLLFGKVSLWGLVVNLFAVGLFGALIVPINLLAGILFVILPSLADALWGGSSFVILCLNELLMFLQGVAKVWLYQNIGVVGVVLSMLAAGVWASPLIHKKFTLIPVLAILLISIQSKSVLPPVGVYVLESDDDYVGQVLIQKRHTDDGVSGETNWLLLTDQNSKKSSLSFAKTLLEQLQKRGIRHLTGVVVQTPSSMMVEALPIIHEEIPIHRAWLAGESGLSKIPHQSCEAGRAWSDDGLGIHALTGWQMIDDKEVWGCSVLIESQENAVIFGGIYHGLGEGDDIHRLLINGVLHPRTWQMYEYMCHDDVLVDAWLIHTRQAVSREIFAMTSPHTLVYTDKNTASNREKVAVAVASLMD